MNDEPPVKSFPIFTAGAVICPVLILGLGVIVGVIVPHSESDWFGASVFVPVGMAIIAASLVAVLCSILAFARRERGALFSIITAIPGLLFLISFLATIFRL